MWSMNNEQRLKLNKDDEVGPARTIKTTVAKTTVATGRVEVSYCVQLAKTKDKTRQKK